ncbi:DUF485 domain-containing protein [Cupriavidus sp. 2TAF22]|uniref:DUF485 domain-containing protein n=1 Tax=unclassified Cupriavidus TaxID=2640874 RepID=UPI003F915AE8
MTTASATRRIQEHPGFRELAARRARLSWTLLCIVLCAYLLLMAMVTMRPAVLARPIAAGAMTNLGIVLAIAVIVIGWAATCIYVARANRGLDRLASQILQEVLS